MPPVPDFLKSRKELLLAVRGRDAEAIVSLFKLNYIDEIIFLFGMELAEREGFSKENAKELGLAGLLYEAVSHRSDSNASFLLKKGADPTLAVTTVFEEDTVLKLAKNLNYNASILHIINETKPQGSPYNLNEKPNSPCENSEPKKPAFIHHRFSAFSPVAVKSVEKSEANLIHTNKGPNPG